MSSIIASHAAAPVHTLNESLQLTEEPHAADANAAEPLSESHPHTGGHVSGTSQEKLSPGGLVAQIFALELERRGIKLNLEQTAAKMGMEMPPKDSTAK